MRGNLAIQIITAIMPILSQQAAVVETVESVNLEILNQQDILDTILYPAYYKDLKESFGSLGVIFGGHDDHDNVFDDVKLFHNIPV